MKKSSLLLVVFAFIGVIVLSSCGGKNNNSENNANDSVQKNMQVKTQVDSLMEVVNGLKSSDFDLKISALKKLPEYKNAIFLTPKECREYLAIFAKLPKKFETETKYFNYHCNNFEKINDSTFGKMDSYKSCKIVFDTTQSITPLALIKYDFYDTYKYKGKKDESTESDHYTFEFFYLSKIKIGYTIMKASHTNGEPYFLDNLSMFDGNIRSGEIK